MSYLKDKLGVSNTNNIRSFLLSEGFKFRNGSCEDELTYFTEGSMYDVWLTVKLVDSEFEYYVDYHNGGGTVHNSTIKFSNDFDTFADEYRDFINEVSQWAE